MFHMEAFSVSDTTSGANTFVQANYVTTNIVLPKSSNGLQVSPALPFLHSVFGLGVSLCHIRVQTPKFAPQPYPNLDPNNRGTAIENPPRIHDFSDNPLPLGPTDELDVFVSQNSGGTETERVFVQTTDNLLQPIPPGKIFSVHAVSATTLVPNQFTPCQLTFDFPLPGGTYALVGARAFSATALAFRVLSSMGTIYRPGGVACQAYDQLDPPGQRAYPWDGQYGKGWGVWVTFFQNVPPQIEMFATSADTAEEFDLDLVQTSVATV